MQPFTTLSAMAVLPMHEANIDTNQYPDTLQQGATQPQFPRDPVLRLAF